MAWRMCYAAACLAGARLGCVAVGGRARGCGGGRGACVPATGGSARNLACRATAAGRCCSLPAHRCRLPGASTRGLRTRGVLAAQHAAAHTCARSVPVPGGPCCSVKVRCASVVCTRPFWRALHAPRSWGLDARARSRALFGRPGAPPLRALADARPSARDCSAVPRASARPLLAFVAERAPRGLSAAQTLRHGAPRAPQPPPQRTRTECPLHRGVCQAARRCVTRLRLLCGAKLSPPPADRRRVVP